MLLLLIEIIALSTDWCLIIVSFVRFGFRQQPAKTAKVGDVSVAAEQAFGATHKDKETTFNNNALGERGLGSKLSLCHYINIQILIGGLYNLYIHMH